MANTKSALKAIRVSERKRQQNKPVRTNVRTRVKQAEKLIIQKNVSAAQEATLLAISTLDKAANKGVIHRNNAARRKSRLMKKLNAAASLENAKA